MTPKYPTVPNALSGIPLLVCPVKHRQLHKGNAIHFNNQTKHGMSHFCQWLWLTYLFQSPLTTCSGATRPGWGMLKPLQPYLGDFFNSSRSGIFFFGGGAAGAEDCKAA